MTELESRRINCHDSFRGGNQYSGGTNIAIYNTHRRLQVLYGADYGLTYSSDVGKGTEVQIRIPAKKDVENK